MEHQRPTPLFHNILTSLIARLMSIASIDYIHGVAWNGDCRAKSFTNSKINLKCIGPFVSGASRQANAALANAAGEYETEAEAVAFILELKKPSSCLPKKLPKFALDSISRSSDGKWRMHYDPMITHSRRKLDTYLWDGETYLWLSSHNLG